MYYYIKGEKVLSCDGFVVIDAGGVGYKIYTSSTSLAALGEGTVTVYTELVVREDAQELYGFATNEELAMFRNLVSVGGVGPKLAKRIILELAGKLKNEDLLPSGLDVQAISEPLSDNMSEACAALTVLGYSASDARRAVAGLDSGLGVEEMVRQALKRLI